MQIASAETKEELNVLEIFYIKKYRKSHETYNIADGGSFGLSHWLGKKRPLSDRLKIKNNNCRFWKGKKKSKEHIAKIKATMNRIANTPEAKLRYQEMRKKSAGFTGHKHSFDSLVKIGKKSKGRIAWNYGLNKLTDIRVAKYGIAQSENKKKGIVYDGCVDR